MHYTKIFKFLFNTKTMGDFSFKKNLENESIDYESSLKKTLDFIAQRRAEILISKGKELKEKYDEINSDSTNMEPLNNEYRIAARDLNELSESDKEIIRKNFERLKKLK